MNDLIAWTHRQIRVVYVIKQALLQIGLSILCRGVNADGPVRTQIHA